MRLLRCLGVIAGAVAVAPGAVPAQQPAGVNLQVYLMTMGAGADIAERFGHNAIWIRDTVARTDAIYNYGIYSFPHDVMSAIGFGARFAMGRPRYWLGVDSSLEHTLAEYRYYRRDLVAQELNLLPAERADLASRLAVNAEPQHRFYPYDYYRDNCSTRVRDMLDVVLHGALRRATRDRPAGGTLRFHTLRSITNAKLLFVGIDAALGPRVDRPLDQWDEMFLPEKVAQHIRELRVAGPDGRDVSLVKSEAPLLTIGIFHVEPAPPTWTVTFALIGALTAGLILGSLMGGPIGVAGRAVATVWLLLLGLGGLLLLFFWFISYNVATYANHNLLLLSPFALGVLPSVWYTRSSPIPRWQWRMVHGLALSVILGVGLALVPIVTRQDNLRIVALTVLPTLAALYVVSRRLGNGPQPNAQRREP